MPITLTATAATEIPEQFRQSAKEVEGKFVVDGLDPTSIVPGAEAAAMRGKLTKAEQDLKRRDERLKSFAKDEAGNIYEPDEFKELLSDYARLKEAQGKAPNIDDLRKQVVAEAEGRYQRKLTESEKRAVEHEKRVQELDRELDRTTQESMLNSILADMRPKEGNTELVTLLLREKLGIDKTDGARTVRVRTPDGKDWLTGAGPDGYAAPRDYALNVLRAQYAHLFQGDGQSGAGAANTGSGRKARFTFKRDDLNGKMSEFLALQAKARAEGQQVEFVD